MEIAALILGTYAITTSLTDSDGAWGVLYKIRHNKAIQSFGLLECHLCTSLYVSASLSFLWGDVYTWLISWGASTIISIAIKAYQSKS